MDKNSVIGLSIIGVILVTFTLLNKPSEAELKAEKAKEAKELALEKEVAKKEALE
jgi:YidC/Oxa1 family membrane protein insertase